LIILPPLLLISMIFFTLVTILTSFLDANLTAKLGFDFGFLFITFVTVNLPFGGLVTFFIGSFLTGLRRRGLLLRGVEYSYKIRQWTKL
jgi:hypothetical protein